MTELLALRIQLKSILKAVCAENVNSRSYFLVTNKYVDQILALSPLKELLAKLKEADGDLSKLVVVQYGAGDYKPQPEAIYKKESE